MEQDIKSVLEKFELMTPVYANPESLDDYEDLSDSEDLDDIASQIMDIFTDNIKGVKEDAVDAFRQVE